MAWIELHQQLPAHPKTRRLARTLGLKVPNDIPQVVGHLCMFWLWCMDFALDGSLERMTAQDIADAAGWLDDPDTFVGAMREVGFIDTHGDIDYVHDWDDYIGRLLTYREKERQRNRVKQQRYRDRERQKKAAGATSDEETPAAAEIKKSSIDQEWLKVVQTYEKNIGLLPYGVSADLLISYYEDMGAEVVCKAIEVTNAANPENPWQYLKAVLDKWIEKRIDTPEKADAVIKEFERKKAARNRKAAGDNNEPPAVSGDFY